MDQVDKMAQLQGELNVLPADAQADAEEKRTPNDIAISVNTTRNRLVALQAAITAQFIEESSRAQLEAKEQEINTVMKQYQEDFALLDMSSLPEATQTKWQEQKAFVEKTEKQMIQLIHTSKFYVASAKVKVLDEIFAKIRGEKEKLTNVYIVAATPEELGEKRSLFEKLKGEYDSEFQSLQLQDLTSDERSHVTSQNGFVGNMVSAVSTHIQEYITTKQQTTLEPIVGQPRENVAQLEAMQKSHDSDIDELRKELVGLKQTNNDLEKKLGSIQVLTTPNMKVIINDNPQEGENGLPSVASTPESNTSGTQDVTVQMKLEGVKLPFFGGDLTEWLPFKAVFVDMIHNNRKMQDSAKFNALRMQLRGVAFDTIKGYQVTGENYNAAWRDLLNRFDRKEELVEDYIRKFYTTMPVVNKATSVSLRRVIDASNQMLHGLAGMKVSTSNWDPMLNFIIKSKLDDQTRNEWKISKGRTELRKTKELLEFLETRAIELLPSQSERLSQMMRAGDRRPSERRIFQVTQPEQKGKEGKLECLICKGNHRVWQCYMLKKECAKVRTEMIKSMGLCFKCLLKHRVGMCDNPDCEYCGGPHNILLCFKREADANKGAVLKTQNYQHVRDSFRPNYDNSRTASQNKSKPNWQAKPNAPKNRQPKPSTSQQADGDWDDEEWNRPTVQKN